MRKVIVVPDLLEAYRLAKKLRGYVKREGDGYVATCPELGIVSQGDTVEEARRNLVEAVEGFFEVASSSEIQRRLKMETYVMPIMPTIVDTP